MWSGSSFAAGFVELSCSFSDLALSSGNTSTCHFCCSVTLLLLSVLVQTALGTSRAASCRCSRISPTARLCVRSCVPPNPVRRRLMRATRRRRRFTATSSGTSFFRSVQTASVSCALRLLTWPLASRCLTCVAVPTFLSSSSWILSLHPVDGEFQR